MEERQPNKNHRFIINNRKSGSITGVIDVVSFDVSEVMLETDMGMLNIKGENLHVSKLNIERGEIEMDGRIDSLVYSEINSFSKKGQSFVNRLFK